MPPENRIALRRERKPDDDGRSASCSADDLDRAPERLDSVLQTDEARAFAWICPADAVVLHDEHQAPVVGRHVHLQDGGARVFAVFVFASAGT
jgi:hypothetical protein